MIQINSERFVKDIEHQARIGWKDEQGLFREAYTKEYFELRDYVQSRMEEAGLKTRVDSVGNLFGRLEGENPKARTILTGSHLDAVVGGGPLDGALGVIASLEALRSIKEAGRNPKHSLEVVGFVAEEGGPLGGTFGSRAFSGLVKSPLPDEVLKSFGLSWENIINAKGSIDDYCAYLELHIEQGPVLWQKGISVGIPTDIVGITRYQETVKGAANHAGTTPMMDRKDALYDAVIILHEWMDFMRKQTDIVCNVGILEVEPGHVSIVPGEVKFKVELRSANQNIIQFAVDRLKDISSKIKTCSVAIELLIQKPPVKLSDQIINAIEQVSQDLKLKSLKMPSMASHDASPISQVMPAGMIFVPSVNGISHHKDEFTDKEDLVRGATVLANTLLKLDATLA